MKESNKLLEMRIKRAMENNVPDVWQNILLRIDEEKSNPKEEPEILVMPIRKKPWIKWASAVATIFVLFITSWGYMNFLPESIVNLEINPSIEMEISRSQKVISVTPLNDDALLIIDGMNLKNTDLNIAINALIGSMVKNGFLSQYSNSILITVDSQNNQKGIELKSKLSKEIEEVLGGYSVEGAILSLSLSEDKQLTPLAEEYGISLGKAALVDLLVQQDVTLDFASIAKLSINDINLLIASKTTYNDDIESIGSASSGGYITVDRVKEIVFNDTGVNPAEVKFIEIDFDYDDGRMVYSVEFENNGSEYDYEIDATTGDIVEVDNHIKDEYNMEHSTWDNTSAPRNEVIGNEVINNEVISNEYIGNATAISIALSNAGLSQREISEMDCELDEDDGIMIYELEFTHGNTEYEYIINAVTGEIVEWEKK